MYSSLQPNSQEYSVRYDKRKHTNITIQVALSLFTKRLHICCSSKRKATKFAGAAHKHVSLLVLIFHALNWYFERQAKTKNWIVIIAQAAFRIFIWPWLIPPSCNASIILSCAKEERKIHFAIIISPFNHTRLFLNSEICCIEFTI